VIGTISAEEVVCDNVAMLEEEGNTSETTGSIEVGIREDGPSEDVVSVVGVEVMLVLFASVGDGMSVTLGGVGVTEFCALVILNVGSA
jgi:hypothetical protein